MLGPPDISTITSSGTSCLMPKRSECGSSTRSSTSGDLPIDVVTAKHAAKEVERIIRESKAKMSVLTGLENPNSVAQLLPWLQERGYRHNSLGKEYVQAAVEREADRLTPECRQVLTLRLDAAKSSVKKFSAIVEGTSPDGTVS
jgi:hypothetical protein